MRGFKERRDTRTVRSSGSIVGKQKGLMNTLDVQEMITAETQMGSHMDPQLSSGERGKREGSSRVGKWLHM